MLLSLHEHAAHVLRVKAPALAQAAADALYRARPELARRYAHLGDAGRRHCVNDLGHHLRFLAASADVGDARIFSDYAAWAFRVMVTHKVVPEDALASFHCLLDVAPPAVGPDEAAFVRDAIHGALCAIEASAPRRAASPRATGEKP
jgi:hypothetical protein